MGDFALETERLILRDWREDDWGPFFQHTNTSQVMRWLGGELDSEGRSSQRARVEGCASKHGHCFWLVERKSDGEVLGFCGLKRADAPASTILGQFEIGWRFRQDVWGQGYAKEAAHAALAAGFLQFGAEEVFALTVIENEASWGLMKRLGMLRREEFDYVDSRISAPFRDTIAFSIARSEWGNL
ncbi:MAG: GNAT family N-acetyltransferase [Croceibacterium sp.]